MMAEPATPLFQSLEDFLTWEEQQAERYEMLPSGVIRLMAGGTGDHDAVAMNIVAALASAAASRWLHTSMVPT